MKKVSFQKYMEHVGITFNHVRYNTQPKYKKLKWKTYQQSYKVFCIGHNYQSEEAELELELKDIT